MVKKILCATDGTEHGNKGVALAAELAALTNAELTVCTVNELQGGLRGPPIYMHESAELKAILDKAAALARKKGVKKVSEIELDGREIAGSIVSYASKNGFDHIVTGTGDKGTVKRLILGSVASKVASTAPCAVTIAR